MKRLLLIPLILLMIEYSFAQEVFTLNRAIEAALEHNHNVRISKIESGKAENLATRGNAGQLPSLAVNSGLNVSYSNLDFTPGSIFQNLLNLQGTGQTPSPQSISFDGVSSTQFNAGLGTQFVIYEGLKGHFRYEMLENNSEMADLYYRAELEITVFSVTRQYIQAVSLQKAIMLKEAALEQSRDRYRIIETRREYGQANEQQLLQALADLKSDSTEFRNLKLQYENAYRELHTAIGWDSREVTTVDESIQTTEMLQYEELLASLLENNTALNVRLRRIENAGIDEKIVKANFLPSLTASAQYGYNYERTSDGLFESQEQIGLMGGLSLKIPIFSGWQTRTASQNAKATIRQEKIRYEDSEKQLRTQFENNWQQYLHLENQLATEQSNLDVFERNYERAKDSFERGLITGVELRSAQLSLENARLRLAEIRFQLKLSETTLLYLSGDLLRF